MGKNGLLDITIVSFVITPLVFTVALLLFIWWFRTRNNHLTMGKLDRPGLLLAAAVRRMPEERRDWGAAMMVELSQLKGSPRWWFALGCIRVALFPPRGSVPRHFIHTLTMQDPICGIMSVALPALGLPFIYIATVILEAIGGSPFTQSSSWSNPAAAMEVAHAIVMIMFSCIPAGVPLGVVGLVRRERQRWLSALGMLLSLSIIGYFMVVMSIIAGGPNGD